VRGYTAKVGLRKPEWECLNCWLECVICTHPNRARLERWYRQNRPLTPERQAEFEEQIRVAAKADSPTYDAGGLLPVVSQTFNASKEPEPIGPTFRPDMVPHRHCTCTYSTGCCHCDEYQNSSLSGEHACPTPFDDPRAQDGETDLRGPDGWWGGS
jgi:hypothetical protein